MNYRPAYVLDGHTLGVLIGDYLQPLRASILRGSPILGSPLSAMEPILAPWPKWGQCLLRIRPATHQDYLDFMVTPPEDL